MRIWIKIAIVFCISFIFVSCSEEPTKSSANNYKIIGKVTDTNGNSLHDVKVYLIYTLLDMPLYRGEKIAGSDTVSLTSFTATADYDKVVLTWITASEINNQGFEVQRKRGGDFEVIAFVLGHGTTNETQVYSYTDNLLTAGTYWYRLKQIDFDGSFNYSNIVEVDLPTQAVFKLEQNYPNPLTVTTKILFSLAADSKVYVKLFDIVGNEVAILISSNLVAGTHAFLFDNSFGLTNNIYRINFEAISVDSIEYKEDVTMLINEDNNTNIIETEPFIRTINGNFEIEISELPIKKIINITLEAGPELVNQEIVSSLLKFVLFKDGYNVLEAEYLVDLEGQNKFNFVMEQ